MPLCRGRALPNGRSLLRAQDSREERTFRVWLLSLLRNEVHIGGLREALRDGYVLLRALDRLAPGCVDWGRCHAPPFKPLHRHPRSVENCNQVRPLACFIALACPLFTTIAGCTSPLHLVAVPLHLLHALDHGLSFPTMLFNFVSNIYNQGLATYPL